jgi:hypothetical protein
MRARLVATAPHPRALHALALDVHLSRASHRELVEHDYEPSSW